ncbi:hypothetical protein [Pseudogulbenkiania sp. MAI-1]|uniref:hypothetical protein n=1 Tax=Pseudogulbenkiania sp. MAI-1 TaxID=990370 RepID=UPI00045EB2E3|nr:hypothetical protein [Pseudogulbenkiania sp. MAI-1]
MTLPIHLPNTAGAAVPAVLLPYQQRWVADPSPLKVIEKSRRTGLTWGEASDDVLTAAAEKSAGGQNVYYIAYNQDMTIEYIEACTMWAKAFDYAAGQIVEGIWDDEADRDKNIKTYTIRFPSGHRIVALSSRPSNLRGRQGIIVIDEAAFHEQLQELLDAAMAMLIWGGKVRVISTHYGVDNPFNELIKDIRGGKRAGTVHRLEFKQAVSEGLYHRVCLRLGKPYNAAEEAAWVAGVYSFYGSGAGQELDCIPTNSAGSYFSRALLESRASEATPVLRIARADAFTLLPEKVREADIKEWCDTELKPLLDKLPKNARSFLGEDFARKGDLTILVPLIRLGLRRRVPFQVEIRNMPFDQQRQILFYILDSLPTFLAAALDARGNGQYLAEKATQKYGATRIHSIQATEAFYLDNFPKLKTALEDGTLHDLPADEDVLTDYRQVQLIRGIPRVSETRTQEKGDGGQASGKRHGDSAIALLMADYASRNEAAPIEFESAPRGQHRDGDADEEYAGFGTGAW